MLCICQNKALPKGREGMRRCEDKIEEMTWKGNDERRVYNPAGTISRYHQPYPVSRVQQRSCSQQEEGVSIVQCRLNILFECMRNRSLSRRKEARNLLV